MNEETVIVLGITFLIGATYTIQYLRKPNTNTRTKLRYVKYNNYPLPLYSNKV
jgi:hypothetical protein